MTAFTDIQYLKGVGAKRAEILKSKGIDTVGALLRFYPRKYLDWTKTYPISRAPFFENVCVRAKIVTPIEELKTKSSVVIYKFIAEDESGRMFVSLFNQRFLAEKLKMDREYLFYGKLDGNFGARQMSSPIIKPADYNVIEPIYPASRDMSSVQLSRLVKTAVNSLELQETLPQIILERNNLCSLKFAVENIHFPMSPEAFKKAKERLVFEELFVLQVALSIIKLKSHQKSGCIIKNNSVEAFKQSLPFELTNAQSRVIDECIKDMQSGRPMTRLIQGDVGSGKTMVAAALCAVAAENGYQSALMAPTEILAEQHFKTLSNINEYSGIKCGLLTGSLTAKQKAAVKKQLADGEIDVIIGTHALIVDDVQFNNLGLVITDEQHRFGVAQREKLTKKGENPHTLVMSATPIPQTLGLILYGDLDISVIDEYPKGRQKIDTYCVDSSYRTRIYNYIKKFLNNGQQGYIVCPLVEDGEESGLKSAKEYYSALCENEFKDYSLGLLHGKMNAKDKEKVMRRFAEGEIQLLVATTVIEVGIDVPNAVVMLIENADRFGLSQLHQLRGRIGRGSEKSDCILISDSQGEETLYRLNVIKSSSDGFEIADKDFELRGPGDFLGNRQHGIPQMKIADIFADKEVLFKAKKEAELILDFDPRLKFPENKELRQEVIDLYKRLNQN
ncbi:MAG: ATP-dependent DNA helicase RecG [Ruminococcaceae bacterium]|nr:ATP-dependent DNA helicase RecG [Oscillospiraceae bacterium]